MRRLQFILFFLLPFVLPAQADESKPNSPDIHRVPDPASGYGALTSLLLPANIALRSELAITPQQLDQLRKIEETYQKHFATVMGGWIGRGGEQIVQDSEMMTELRNAQKQIATSVAEILREEQFRRLRQIEFQRTTLFHSLVPLSWDPVMMELGLSPREQARFEREVKTRSEALNKVNIDSAQRVPDEIARLVTPEQRQKLAEVYGEPLENVTFYDQVEPPNSAYRGQGMSSILLGANSPIIAKDLEILDEQAEQITALSIENRRLERNILQKRSREQRDATRVGKGDLGPPVDELKALREAVDKRLADILLPQQIERLKQLDFQIRVAREAAIPLLSKTAATAIGLTEEKQRELQEAYVRVSHSVQHERDRAYYNALDELLKTLTPEQQNRYHLLVGKRFDKWFQ